MALLRRPSFFSALLVVAFALGGCTPQPSDCDGGTCDPAPVCPAGTQPLNGMCAADDGGTDAGAAADPCEPNPCTAPGRSVCVASGAAFVCACDPGHVPAGESCVEEQTCVGEHAGDAFEPDECAEGARVVPAAGLSSEAHTLGEVSGDVDWFRISAAAGDSWRIDWTTVGTLPVGVDVYRADGMALVASARPPAFRSLAFRAEADGDYFVRISGSVPGTKGSYSVSITNDGPDQHPAGPETTVPAVLGGEVAGRLQFAGDHDAVRLAVPARHHVVVEARWTDGRNSLLNLVVTDEQGGFIQQANAQLAQVSLYFQVATTVVLRVQDSADQATGAWAIKTTDRGFDDHGDAASSATLITGSTAAAPAAFERPGDVDVFAFQATGGHVYRFTCAALMSSSGCAVKITDPAGAVMSWRDSSVELRVEIPVSGVAVIEVGELGAPAAYSWSFEDMGAEDHGDSPTSATPVTAPVLAQPARFELKLDSDAYAFTGVPGHIYRAKCTPTTASQCELNFVDPLGGTWVSVNSPGEATVSITDAGIYTFVARLGATHQPGDYTFTLEDLGPDDHGNTQPSATVITASSTATPAALEGTRDRDVFKFTATPGALWSFECLQLFQCRVTIVNAGATKVAEGTGAASVFVTQTADFWVSVEGTHNSPGQTYQWRLTASADDHGNANGSATPIFAPPTATVNGTFNSPGDIDMFVLTPTWGSTYDLTCAPASGVTCQITVRNQLGQLVDMDTGSVFAMSRFKARTPNTTYYVEVKSFTASQTGTYTLSLVEFAPDDHGDLPDWATAIPALGASVSGAINMTGDEDWFAITVPPGTYTATITGMSAEIYAVDQNWVGLGTGPAGNPLTFTAPASGPAYLRVRWGGGGSTTTGNYAIVIQ